MKVSDIDEMQDLINKYRSVVYAKSILNDFKEDEDFINNDIEIHFTDVNKGLELPDMSCDLFDIIGDYLDERYNKITSRIEEL